MALGKVKWFNDAKGFGMIENRDGQDIFVHFTAIMADGHKTLSEGEDVQYDIYEGNKGPLARNVVTISNF